MLFELSGLSPIKISPQQSIKIQKALNTLYVGQIIKSVVVSNRNNDKVILNINGQTISAKTKHPFQPGETLDLKVAKTGKQTLFEVINRDNGKQMIQQAQRQILPKQMPANQLLNILNAIDTMVNKQVAQLPQHIINQVNQLLNTLLPKQAIENAQLLKQAIQNNGVLLEKKLLEQFKLNKTISHKSLKPPMMITHDFKTQLFQLAKVLDDVIAQIPTTRVNKSLQFPSATIAASTHKNSVIENSSQNNSHSKITQDNSHYKLTQITSKHESVPIKGAIPQPLKLNQSILINWEMPNQILSDLKQHVTHSIARIQANQLASISHETQVSFLIDLPIKQEKSIDVLPMLIEENNPTNKKSDTKKTWSVMLALNLEKLGQLQIKITLNDDNAYLNFWLDSSSSLHAITNEKKIIAKEFESIQLSLTTFQTHLGLQENIFDNKKNSFLDLTI
jgi:Flagellar hook-length control protein FliK